MVNKFNLKELNSAQIEKLKSLYRDGFPDDTENDLDFVFSDYFKTVFVNDDFSAVLYPVVKTASFRGVKSELPYIVAFSALKNVRGSGAAAEVMNAYIKKMNDNGMPFTALYPFNRLYYKRYGFTDIDAALEYDDSENYTRIAINDREDILKVMGAVYGKTMKKYGNYLIRTQADNAVAYDKAMANGGDFYVYIGSDTKTTDNIETRANVTINGRELSAAGYSIEFNGDKIEKVICGNENIKRKLDNVQMRICNPVEAVRITPFERNLGNGGEYSVNVRIIDAVLGDKNYNLRVKDGHGVLSPTDNATEIAIGIDKFTDFIVNGTDIEGMPNNLIAKTSSYFIDKY